MIMRMNLLKYDKVMIFPNIPNIFRLYPYPGGQRLLYGTHRHRGCIWFELSRINGNL